MTFSTRFGCRWLTPLAVAGLLAGCQSSRLAFQFAPAPYARPAQPLAAAAPAANPAPAVTPQQLAALPAPLRRLARRLVAHPVPARAGRAAPAVASPVAVNPAPAAEGASLPRPHRHQAAPARTAENGLGHIALFFLAVFLAVLAGLGALLSLIPGISFFGGVGLAAAGLLVLFLLYSLFSGGKKKSK